jgi:glycosyltransferase involved in cell wall biosynthesis
MARRKMNRTPPMLRVAAVTGGLNVPSRRLRIEQLLPILPRHGVCMEELLPRISSYPPNALWRRPGWLAAALAERLSIAQRTRAYDMVVLQREMISTLYTCEGLTGQPRVLDVDDAIHLYRNGWAARKLARACALVLCGNAYLSEWYQRHHPRVRILPTAVDTQRFHPAAAAEEPAQVILGWIGSGSNLHYLRPLMPTLKRLFQRHPHCRLRIVSDRRPDFPELHAQQIEYIRWSAAIEAAAVRGMHIGLMPLDDGAWERGKCSLKMLQYMACGLPVVVSAVGMNKDLLAQAEIGYGIGAAAHWLEPLHHLVLDTAQRQRMGAQGRRLAQMHYSVATVAQTFAAHLHELALG